LLIVPDAGDALIPQNASCLYASATAPSGFANHDGTATPDLTSTFIRIAANATTDGGATGGTTANHSHTTASHTHTWITSTNHTHANTDCGPSDSNTATTIGTGSDPILGLTVVHVHTISFSTETSDTTMDSQAVPLANSGFSIEPAHTRLACIKNTGSAALPDGVIVPYKGTLTALGLLSDWKLCDGTGGTPDLRSRQIKCAFTSVGNTAGSNTHTHNGTEHSHTSLSSHTHTPTGTTLTIGDKRVIDSPGAVLKFGDSGPPEYTPDVHSHVWTCNPTFTVTGSTAAPAGSTSDHRDPYLNVLWVKYVAPTARSFGIIIG
jgi:hypothetical protein